MDNFRHKVCVDEACIHLKTSMENFRVPKQASGKNMTVQETSNKRTVSTAKEGLVTA
ncbi:hypothetical protein KIN20_017362 [Parelaphostrongylus tenuis]|uniref:Uncharacterized protein n=1 Tax=Parelaphostrongylus tenuis TaxID=148309 RepID=A0AAD5N2H2_PARTN|nr:hypothetical protein KIN20_017362 [Parelaphostrongylus tenuis]